MVSTRFRRARRCLTIGSPALLALACPAQAQQTIINVPSVDQTKKDHVFFLHESQVRDWADNDFWLTTNFLTYGVTDRLEVAVTTYNLGRPRARNEAIGTGWKTAQPLFQEGLPDLDLKLGAGQMLIFSLTGKNPGVWSYGQAAFRIPGLRTRIMAGVSNGPTALFGQRTTHMIASYEQPLTLLGDAIGGKAGKILSKMTLLGEWWSGRHELADFVPGVNYHTDKLVVIVGYKFSNKPGRRGDGLILEVGTTF